MGHSVPDPAADENADHEGEPVTEADAEEPAIIWTTQCGLKQIYIENLNDR